MAKGQQDNLYRSALEEIIDFKFDDKVVSVFPDMIQRSVPGYSTIISNIGVLAGRYAQADSYCYDLGCSLGAASLSMRQHIQHDGCEIIAIDNSAEMIEQAKQLLEQDNQANPDSVQVHFICADITEIAIEQASVVVMNFTLQFIPLDLRQVLINTIYQGLKPGGVLVLSEKLAFSDSSESTFLNDAHHDFKRDNGYSDMEISQKRSALENVLLPETLVCHQERLNEAGFSFNTAWFQCFNFASMIAVK